ncbi:MULTISPECIES: cell division protein SepF [unclassified Arthrobacter]|uniref:cell division protein SepF n=1 Tax=unclassified Arthrobacter TaxID=235627 RepID=UPI001E540EDB|nr:MULTISPECIES: cell division protein SepF [unclassified Arthrobacter]MCC9145043.1 cell division protein SepF [Arthrobacter sp. zg-Y919]MDK1276271.1 cell division protein SepF [Arthrobacter sp. zg.Y919]MDM7988910.1 cell division protein SepF [Arthrobacter sp. zg-Y877]WIB02123.1 cell division protein SepF [Arthrobacter sp. zg-Y919]
MAGAMRRTMIYLGLADGDEHYESEQRQLREAPAREEDYAPIHEPDEEAPEAVPAPVVRNAVEEYRAPVTPIKRAPSSREDVSGLRQITTVHPRSYNDAKLIGESFRDGIPVIMNVTDMGEADAKRLVDFSAGLVFGLRGSIERVTNKVFLLSPSYVEVLGDDKKISESQATFFNQS